MQCKGDADAPERCETKNNNKNEINCHVWLFAGRSW